MIQKPTLFSPLLALYYFFYFAMVGVYIIFMPKVLTDLGYSEAEVGIIYAAAPFMRFLLPFVFRHLISLTPKVYLLSLLLTALSTLLFFSTIANFEVYLLANLLFGAAVGISLPYVEAIALARLPKERYGKVRLWGSVGFILIALWLGRMLEGSQGALLYLSALAFATFVVGALLIGFDHKEQEATDKNDTFSLGRYWAFWLSVFLMQVSFGGFYNYFTIYEIDHGVSLQTTSYLWTFGVVCEIAMLYFGGSLLKRNLLKILQFSTLIAALRWLLLYLWADSLSATYASQALHAISFALYHTAAITYIYSLYTQKKLAQQFFLGIAFGLGGAVGAFIAGQVYGEYLFMYEALIAFMAFLVLLLHQKRKKEISNV